MAFDIAARAAAQRALRRQVRSPEDGGGAPDAAPAQNRAAIHAAFAAAPDKFALVSGSYQLDSIPVSDPVILHAGGQQASILIPPGLRQLDLRGAELKMGNTFGISGAAYLSYGYPCLRSYLAADVAAGDTTLRLEAGQGAKWSPGDEFVYRLGSFTFDTPEPLQWGMAKVRAINGDVLTLDAPMPAAFSLASVDGTAANNYADALVFNGEFGDPGSRNKTLHRWPLHKDLEVCNGAITGDINAVSEIALIVTGGKRVTYRNLVARNFGAGFGLQYVDGATIENCATIDCNPIQASLSKGIGLAECRGVQINNCYFEGLRICIGMEASGEAWVNGGRFHNTGNAKTKVSYGVDCIAFAVQGRAQLIVRDFTITGHGGYRLSEIGNGATEYDGRVRFEGRLTLVHPTMPLLLGAWDDMNCVLDMTIAGTRELWDFTQPRWHRRRIWLRNGNVGNFLNLPAGVVKQVQVYTSSGVASADIQHLFLARPGNNGTNYAAALVPGQQVKLTLPGGTDAWLFDRRSQPLKLAVNTAAGSSLDAGDQFIDIHCLIVPDLMANGNGGLSDADVRNSAETNRTARFVSSAIPAITAGGTWQATYAVANMAAGDLIEAVSHNPGRAGVTIRDAYAAAGGCVVIYENLGAATSIASASTIVIEWRKPPTDL